MADPVPIEHTTATDEAPEETPSSPVAAKGRGEKDPATPPASGEEALDAAATDLDRTSPRQRKSLSERWMQTWSSEPAAPQAQSEPEPEPELESTVASAGSQSELEDCHLTPLVDASLQQHLALRAQAQLRAPPLSVDDVPGEAASHPDEVSPRGDERREPRRTRDRLRGGAWHSSPRTSPYRSTLARRRNHDSGRPLGLRETTAPPATASFAYQSSRFQHALLQPLGEFLAEPFAAEPRATTRRKESTPAYEHGRRSVEKIDGRGDAVPSSFAKLKNVLWELTSPRATDIQQLLMKLETQFHMLSLDLEQYAIEHGSNNDNSGKNPHHPLNDPALMREVHFVGRKAVDPSVVALTTTLIRGDKFAAITEVWLNDNLISDDGAAAIACFLQLPSCALEGLWLGNNQIGPVGTALISGALSNNETSELKSLGLYSNPIGNGGASTLAQMLRTNHVLTTLDLHGCGGRREGQRVLVTARDGTRYVARVVAPLAPDGRGPATDGRFLDAVRTFVAFNRLDPSREQLIRGLMAEPGSGAAGADGAGEQRDRAERAAFLAALSRAPAHERVTAREKRTWKYLRWKVLLSEFKRARAEKAALGRAGRRGDSEESHGGAEFTIDDDDDYEEYINPVVETEDTGEEGDTIGGDLDDEVVVTDPRSWREVKVGITG